MYLQKNNSLTSLKWQTHLTMTYNNDVNCHLPYTVYEFRLCSIFISVFKNVNMIKCFEEEEELEKQGN